MIQEEDAGGEQEDERTDEQSEIQVEVAGPAVDDSLHVGLELQELTAAFSAPRQGPRRGRSVKATTRPFSQKLS